MYQDLVDYRQPSLCLAAHTEGTLKALPPPGVPRIGDEGVGKKQRAGLGLFSGAPNGSGEKK